MFVFKPMFWLMLFLQAKQNALIAFLSFCSHDLYPSFSSNFLLKWYLPSSLTLKTNTEMPEKESLNTCANQTCAVHLCPHMNERALGTKRSLFLHFVSISRVLYLVYLNICFHWLSFTLKL